MRINKINGRLRVCFSAKELTLLIVSKFFINLATKIKSKRLDEVGISKNIKKLANLSVDSHDYEYFTSILELYEQFERSCDFCFNLKPTFNYKKNNIKSLDDLVTYVDDPPDVIVYYENQYYEFELKRYRDELLVDSIFNFLKKKIILHYSEQRNYLILLQPPPFSDFSTNVFKELHEKLLKEKNIPGIIGFSLNNNNEEMLLVRIFPNLDISKRKYKTEVNMFAELLHSE